MITVTCTNAEFRKARNGHFLTNMTDPPKGVFNATVEAEDGQSFPAIVKHLSILGEHDMYVVREL